MPDINPLYLMAGLSLLGLAPFFLMMVTSYVKIVVVTSLVRNALGVQQVPPTMVMNGLAIILSVFIMAPVAMDTADIVKNITLPARPGFADILDVADQASPRSDDSSPPTPMKKSPTCSWERPSASGPRNATT